MHNVNVNIKTIHIWHAVTCLGDWTPNNARLTDQENRFSDHFVFLRPIASAARMGNVEMVMNLLACGRIDINKGASSLGCCNGAS
jgi:hypothetical protein